MSASTAILVEVDVTSPAGATSTLRFADAAFRPFAPSDPDRPNLVWDSRLIEAPVLRRFLFEDFASLAPSLGVGLMRLSNGDGALDAYQAYVWGEIRVWLWTEGAAFAEAELLFQGPADLPRYADSGDALSSVTVGFWDYRAELEKPVQTSLYTGGNDGASVLYEGEAEGLKGQAKPLAWGDLREAHIPAPQVNGAVYAYQLHDGAIGGDETIFDRGDDAGFVDDGDLADGPFDAATPAPAHYATNHARGLLKIDGSPVGPVSFGFKGDAADGYVETAGPILRRILLRAGVPDGRIGASVAALAAAAVIGVYDQAGARASELTGLVARGAPAALLPGRNGVWEAFPIAPPAGVADFTVSPDMVLRLEADPGSPPPVGEVRVGYGRTWTTFSRNELAPALWDTNEATRLAEEYRWATAEDATLKARLESTWRRIEIETALRAETDAQVLADALLALFGLRPDGKPRRQWRVQLEATPAALALPLGKTVRLQYPPRGVDDRLLLIGEEPLKPRRDLVTWTLWG